MGFMKGYTPWNKGLTKETDERMRKTSNSLKGQHRSLETEFKKGHKMPKEWVNRIAQHHRENPNSGQFKKGHIPVNKFEVGRIPWNKGIPTQTNTGKTHFKKGSVPWNKGKTPEQIRGEKHWRWNGGTSDKGYAETWTDQLREEVRRRDNYECETCGTRQDTLGYKLDIHHMDEDKTNNKINNLVSLCRSCHIHIYHSTR